MCKLGADLVYNGRRSSGVLVLRCRRQSVNTHGCRDQLAAPRISRLVSLAAAAPPVQGGI